jgi:ribosomal protein S12 methylthiotransferase accessory factor YcaO
MSGSERHVRDVAMILRISGDAVDPEALDESEGMATQRWQWELGGRDHVARHRQQHHLRHRGVPLSPFLVAQENAAPVVTAITLPADLVLVNTDAAANASCGGKATTTVMV